jgi:hypothetical protein
LDISLLALLGRNIIRKALAPVIASRKKETNENIDECLQQNRFNLLNVPKYNFFTNKLTQIDFIITCLVTFGESVLYFLSPPTQCVSANAYISEPKQFFSCKCCHWGNKVRMK